MNNTPVSSRLHIGFFGCTNAGKSSLVNAVTDQNVALVSQTRGTTTDPVMKTMELLPLGPIVLVDTAGTDDIGVLGKIRVERTKRVLNKTDIAVLVVDATIGIGEYDRELEDIFKEKKIPYIIAYNKCDLTDKKIPLGENEIYVSAVSKEGIQELKEKIGKLKTVTDTEKRLVGDLVKPKELVVLVVPIDASAPKDRLILPQQMAIRDILNSGAIPVVVRDTELKEALDSFAKPPSLVITDSQAFGKVSKIVPKDIPLTSFSILMAGYKGLLEPAIDGVCAIERLKCGDKVLISEGCTHHRQCEDIGTVKIPKMLREYTREDIVLETSSGGEFPEDLTKYSLIIHCGGCMLNEREMSYRVKCALDAGVPITNYGTAIAYMNGILKRSVGVFPHLADKL